MTDDDGIGIWLAARRLNRGAVRLVQRWQRGSECSRTNNRLAWCWALAWQHIGQDSVIRTSDTSNVTHRAGSAISIAVNIPIFFDVLPTARQF